MATFWAIVLYGDVVIRWAGPILVVAILILGMYSRRYSPLSSTSVHDDTPKKDSKGKGSEAPPVTHQKTLDEIVETLRMFTSRCNVLLDPLLQLTDFLSTQRTATTATTRPALTALLIRILLITPIWVILTLPYFHVITTRRVVLAVGTFLLTWHSKPNRVSREILWRSSLIRQITTTVTGLNFTSEVLPSTGPDGRLTPPTRAQSLAASLALRNKSDSPGVRFTFILFENQRRWIGLGWTQSLFTYERAPWTDEHLNPASSKDEFELPEVEGGEAKWRWVERDKWLVEGAGEFDEGGIKTKADADGGQGWVYFDNKWEHGRRGQDSWGRYTRRRKWYRDAELVEASTPTPSQISTPTPGSATTPSEPPPEYSERPGIPDDGTSPRRTTSGLRKGSLARRRTSQASSTAAGNDNEEGVGARRGQESLYGISDDVRMGLE